MLRSPLIRTLNAARSTILPRTVNFKLRTPPSILPRRMQSDGPQFFITSEVIPAQEEPLPLTDEDLERTDINNMQPEEIMKELDRYIVGQVEAKKAVAIAMRNRWRRKQVPEPLRKEIVPKNILMIGPTGVGKTEVARRIAKLADAPFIKVEATKFTEVGFRGADVDQIIKDLVEVGINLVRERELKKMEKIVNERVEENLLELVLGKPQPNATKYDEFIRNEIRQTLRDRQMENLLVDYEPKPFVHAQKSGKGGQMNLLGLPMNLHQLIARVEGPRGSKKGTRKMAIKDIRPLEEQAVRATLLRDDLIVQKAIREVEEYGIVFIDELDKIVGNTSRYHADASDEGVQRDLLPIIEGTKITTDHGEVDTSKILFITAGAFHHAKPSDLLAELQGRLPIRVQLEPLTAEHLYRILTEPEPNLIRQHIALMKTEDVDLEFTDAAIRRIANIASEINDQVENIGARRLYTVLEKVLEDISFNASRYRGQKVVIDDAFVDERLKDSLKHADLKAYIL